MIKNGKAYVDSQTSEAMRVQKGTPTVAGSNSPFRDRSVEENLALFEKMKQGEFKEGEHVLRAKIDKRSNAQAGLSEFIVALVFVLTEANFSKK